MRSMTKYASAHMQERLSSFKSRFRLELVSRTMSISSKQTCFKNNANIKQENMLQEEFSRLESCKSFKRCLSYLICLARVSISVQTSGLYNSTAAPYASECNLYALDSILRMQVMQLHDSFCIFQNSQFFLVFYAYMYVQCNAMQCMRLKIIKANMIKYLVPPPHLNHTVSV